MSTKCLTVLPILAALFLLASLLASYLIGILHKGSIDYVPYPSDLGLEQPERGIFSVGLAFSGSIIFAVILLRFIQVNTFYPRLCFHGNILSFVSGIFMLIGLYIVPAYAYDQHPYIHYVGAGMHFFFMIVFMIVQTRITVKHPYNHTKCLGQFRTVLTVLSCLCPIVFACGRIFAPKEKKRYYIPQATEWFISLLFWIFMCSFGWDFRRIHLRLNSYEVCPRSPDSRKLTRKALDSDSAM